MQRAPGFPCALCIMRAKGKTQTPGETRRGIAKVWLLLFDILNQQWIVDGVRSRATFSAVVAWLDRAIQYSRDASDGAEKPRRTGYPHARV